MVKSMETSVKWAVIKINVYVFDSLTYSCKTNSIYLIRNFLTQIYRREAKPLGTNLFSKIFLNSFYLHLCLNIENNKVCRYSAINI